MVGSLFFLKVNIFQHLQPRSWANTWLSIHSRGEDSSFLCALCLAHMAGPELSVLFISKVPALSLWHSQMFAKAFYWLQLLILIKVITWYHNLGLPFPCLYLNNIWKNVFLLEELELFYKNRPVLMSIFCLNKSEWILNIAAGHLVIGIKDSATINNSVKTQSFV